MTVTWRTAGLLSGSRVVPVEGMDPSVEIKIPSPQEEGGEQASGDAAGRGEGVADGGATRLPWTRVSGIFLSPLGVGLFSDFPRT